MYRRKELEHDGVNDKTVYPAIRLCTEHSEKKKKHHSSNETGRGDAYPSVKHYTVAEFSEAGNMTPYKDEIHVSKRWIWVFSPLFSF